MIIRLSKIKKISIAAILLFVTTTCNKDSYQNFPYVSVNITLSITNDLSALANGSSIVCPVLGGDKGIILFRLDPDYFAYDRLCTNYPSDTCAVNIDNSGIRAVCPCCHSIFSLIDGSVSAGPAKYALKQYNAVSDGGRLYIRN